MASERYISNIKDFRLLTPRAEPDYLILRITALDGQVFNFGLPRKYFAEVVKIWNLDLGAIGAAIANGQPIPETAKRQG